VKRGGSRLRGALIASALLHVGVIGFFWAASSSGAEMAPLKVYAVNIVSPPPRELGDPAPERVVAEAEPAPEPQPEAAPPAPEPTPAAPQPTPPPPQPAQPRPTPPAPREQPRAAQPATPPAQPRQQPAPARQTPPQQQPAPAPARQTPPPREQPPAAAPPAARPAPAQSSPPRQGEPAARPAPSTGQQPSPASPGGENLAIRTEGAVCPSEAYCNNIAAMVQRYFRRPPNAYSDRGDVCFRIARDGSVADLEVQRLRGSFQFRLALMEAVEQAARRNEFGPLPRQFASDWLPVCVGVTPQM
jgi:hypothetical protein